MYVGAQNDGVCNGSVYVGTVEGVDFWKINRVVPSPTYKMAPPCRAQGQEKDSQKNRMEIETGTGHSEEKTDETKIKKT